MKFAGILSTLHGSSHYLPLIEGNRFAALCSKGEPRVFCLTGQYSLAGSKQLPDSIPWHRGRIGRHCSLGGHDRSILHHHLPTSAYSMDLLLPSTRDSRATLRSAYEAFAPICEATIRPGLSRTREPWKQTLPCWADT